MGNITSPVKGVVQNVGQIQQLTPNVRQGVFTHVWHTSMLLIIEFKLLALPSSLFQRSMQTGGRGGFPWSTAMQTVMVKKKLEYKLLVQGQTVSRNAILTCVFSFYESCSCFFCVALTPLILITS